MSAFGFPVMSLFVILLLAGCLSLGDRVVFIEGSLSSSGDSAENCYVKFSSGFRDYHREKIQGDFSVSYIITPNASSNKLNITCLDADEVVSFNKSYDLKIENTAHQNIKLGIIK